MPVDSTVFNSSMIQSAEYDAENNTLVTVMNSGKVYTSPNVTPEQWSDFKGAGSAGSWFRRNIMGLSH